MYDLLDLCEQVEDNSEYYLNELFPDDVQEALFESGLELEFE